MLLLPCLCRTDIFTRFIVKSHELYSIAHFRKPCRSLHTKVCPESDRDLTFACAVVKTFGSDKKHSVCSAGAIYCRRCGILKYRYTLYILRIDGRKVTFDPIYKNKRIGVAYRTYTADTYGRTVLTWLAACRSHCHTRKQSLKPRSDIRDRPCRHLVAVYHGNRTGKVHLLLHPVTNNDHFIKELGIFPEHHIHHCTAVDSHCLVLISEERYIEHGIRGNCKCIAPFPVSHSPVRSTRHKNTCSDYRHTFSILHDTGHLNHPLLFLNFPFLYGKHYLPVILNFI